MRHALLFIVQETAVLRISQRAAHCPVNLTDNSGTILIWYNFLPFFFKTSTVKSIYSLTSEVFLIIEILSGWGLKLEQGLNKEFTIPSW